MSDPFIKRYFRIPRTEIAYLRFILESYDGLAFMSTVESRLALVAIGYSHSRRQDAEALLSALAEEVPMEEAAPEAAENF